MKNFGQSFQDQPDITASLVRAFVGWIAQLIGGWFLAAVIGAALMVWVSRPLGYAVFGLVAIYFLAGLFRTAVRIGRRDAHLELLREHAIGALSDMSADLRAATAIQYSAPGRLSEDN